MTTATKPTTQEIAARFYREVNRQAEEQVSELLYNEIISESLLLAIWVLRQNWADCLIDGDDEPEIDDEKYLYDHIRCMAFLQPTKSGLTEKQVEEMKESAFASVIEHFDDSGIDVSRRDILSALGTAEKQVQEWDEIPATFRKRKSEEIRQLLFANTDELPGDF